MASWFLLIHLAYTCCSKLAHTAVPPVNVALNQPAETLGLAGPSNPSTLQNKALLNTSITFNIPGTQTSLIFSRFSEHISQSELDLCVIEGMDSIFSTVLAKGRDGSLPLNSVDYKYGNVVINVHDYSAPTFRMTYASVVSTLRGIALFASIYGYYGMAFEVYQGKMGHVGTGDLGPIIPR